MHRVVLISVMLLLVFISSIANAECERDIDCDGDLKCLDGECKGESEEDSAETNEAVSGEPQLESEPESEPESKSSEPEPAQEEAASTASETVPGAQCGKDTDCKGLRICNNGVCEDPHPQETDQPQLGSTDERPLSAGWALGGAICGFIGLGAVTGLGAAAAVTADDTIPSIPLGAAATVTLAVMGPLTFAGGKSARRGAGVRGILGLRIPGWITWGISLGNALVLIGVGVSVDVPPWQIMVTTIIGDLSLILFSVDALVSRSQAKRVIRENAHKSDHHNVALSPLLAPVYGPDGVSGGILGLGGSF
ncbi:MAG: hypothetical protein GY847_04880 [Proteobacteria bacterium]|nr:hypothetical protein [Pseudomonadota bacterium]